MTQTTMQDISAQSIRAQSIWAVVPIKDFAHAQQRLSGLLSPPQRQILARTMATAVLTALADVAELAGIAVVTADADAAALARHFGARVITEGAEDGHTGAVDGARRVLTAEGQAGILTMPGDIPLVTPDEVRTVLAAARPAPSFTIVPAHDELGSNAVLCAPPFSVKLRFGEDSYFPHLDAARAAGIAPTIVPLPGIGMDIDHPVDLLRFLGMAQSAGTPTAALLRSWGVGTGQ